MHRRLQAIQRLRELEVFRGAKLGRWLQLVASGLLRGFVFQLLACFLACLFARLVLLLRALPALQVLLEIGLQRTERGPDLVSGPLTAEEERLAAEFPPEDGDR